MEKEKHIWDMQPRYGAYCTPYRCSRCGAKRVYEWTPGWPGWYKYYLSNGNYSANEGRIEPDCNDGPLFTGVAI